jgi:hypothetical protein
MAAAQVASIVRGYDRMIKLAVGIAASLAMLAGTSVAQGAERYAAPDGTGNDCTEAKPCALPEAITGAITSDEVIVTAGAYTVFLTLKVPIGAKNVQVHGDFGAPMPKISGSLSGGRLIEFADLGGRLSYLDLTNSADGGSAARCTTGGRVDRVRATAVGDEAVGLIQIADCAVRDSVVRADGNESIALAASAPLSGLTGVVRNVTAIATGSGSTGARASFSELIGGASYTLEMRNVIADGSASDLKAVASFGVGKIVAMNSNFNVANPDGAATITGSANQTPPPIFVDAANGDYRQAPGSPTIDAGSTDQIGALDFAGNPRTLGAAPDIGAFEFIPSPSAVGRVESLTLAPKTFKPLNGGSAIFSRKAPKIRVGTTVRYGLTAAATVDFSVERAGKGRKVKGKCRKKSRQNQTRRKCTLYKPVKGRFSHTGTGGPNRFKFSGRLRRKALTPGRYRLVARAGGSVRRAAFKIVR